MEPRANPVVASRMQELDDLRPTPPPWLKGIALAELAQLVLITAVVLA